MTTSIARHDRPSPVLPLAVAVAALAVLFDALGLPIDPVRAAAGLFLVAWAPGAALLELVRPRFLAPSARAVLAVPISLSLAAVAGIALDRTDLGVRPTPMAAASLALTAVFLAAGAWRGRGGGIVGASSAWRIRRPPVEDAGTKADGRATADMSPATTTGADTRAWARSDSRGVASARARADVVAEAMADARARAGARARARAAAEARARAAAMADAGAAAEAPATLDAAAPGPRDWRSTSPPTPDSPQRLRHSGPRGAARAAVAHLRDPLFLNAYALGLSGVLTSGLGVVYWAVAARLYPADVVGINASLLSLVTLLANVSQLNLRSGFGRFVPVAGERVQRLVHAGYIAATLLALVTGVAVVVVLAVAPSLLADVRLTPVLAWLFPVSVVLWTVFTVQDHVLIGLRRTAIVPIENGVFAFAKILLLFPLAGAATAYGILISWTLPTVLGVVIISGWILARLVPRARDRARFGRTLHAADSDAERDEAAGAETVAASAVTPGAIVRYVAGDYLGSLLAIGSSSILPVLVLAVLGGASSAHFYMVGMIATATQLVPSVLATSLLVEVSSGRATFEEDGVRVTRQLALLLGPIALFLVVFADPVLRIFGAAYASDGATALRLLALAGIPWAVINIAFIRLRLEQRVRWVVAAQAVLAVLLVVPAVVVLPTWGITGIGVVTLASQSLVAIALGWSELRTVLPAAAGLPLRRARA